jgi:hypothetical protein
MLFDPISNGGTVASFSVTMLLWLNQRSSHQLIPVIQRNSWAYYFNYCFENAWKVFFVDSFCLLHADAQGSDNPIPLSPQWLLPKPGESKPGVGTGVWYHNLFTVLMIFYHQNLLIHGQIFGFYIIFLRWMYPLAVTMQSM